MYIPGLKEALEFFLFTMVELAVLFVGISFLVGVIHEFMPQEKVKRWLSGRNGRGYVLGSLLGALTPFCSCSTIPVMVGLLRAGAGFGPTMAFLFTSPLVNPIIIPLFITLLGVKVTVVYVGVAIGMAVTISYFLQKAGFLRFVKDEIVNREEAKEGAEREVATTGESCCVSEPRKVIQLQPAVQCCAVPTATTSCCGQQTSVLQPQLRARFVRISRDAFGQFRSLLLFIVIGVVIGSAIHGFLPAELVASLAGADNPLAVPVSAVIGAPLYIRASTMVPVAATLVAKGMSYGAVVALIIGGAGASLPEVAMLKGLFRLPLLAAFLGSVLAIAIFAGFLVNLVM